MMIHSNFKFHEILLTGYLVMASDRSQTDCHVGNDSHPHWMWDNYRNLESEIFAFTRRSEIKQLLDAPLILHVEIVCILFSQQI